MNFRNLTYLFIIGLIYSVLYQIILSLYPTAGIFEKHGTWLVSLSVSVQLVKMLFFWMFIRYFKPKRSLLVIAVLGIIFCSLFRIALISQLNVLVIEDTTRVAIKSLFINLESVFLLVFIGEILRITPDSIRQLKKSALFSFYAHFTIIILFILYTGLLMLGVNSNQFIDWVNTIKLPVLTVDILIFIWFLINLAKYPGKLLTGHQA
jgi:hypothetical protein